MSLAFSWVQYNNTPTIVGGRSVFEPTTLNAPFLFYGTCVPGNDSSKFVLGLRFINSPVQNVKVWLDGTKADLYPVEGAPAELRQDITSDLLLNFKYCILTSTEVAPLTPARLATTTNIVDIDTTLIAIDIMDGVTLSKFDRVLVKNQTAPEENGIYTISEVYNDQLLVLGRSTDLDTSAEIVRNKFVGGPDSYYLYVNTPTPTLGTTNIEFVDRSTRVTYNADVHCATHISNLAAAVEYMDGVQLIIGSTVLLTGQNDSRENGIYEVTSVTDAGDYRYTRHTLFPASGSMRPFTKHPVTASPGAIVNGGKTFIWYWASHYPVTESDFDQLVTITGNIAFAEIASGTPPQYAFTQFCLETPTGSFSVTDGGTLTGMPNMMWTDTGQTMVNVVVNNRVLVRAQTNAAHNGIYYVHTVGTGSNGVWKRTTDLDSSGEIIYSSTQTNGSQISQTAGNPFFKTYLAPGSQTLNTSTIRWYPNSREYLEFAVKAASTSDIVLGGPGTPGPAVIDGVVMAKNDAVLLKDQSPATENGVYTLTTAPTVVLTRIATFDHTTHSSSTERVEVVIGPDGDVYHDKTYDLYSPPTWSIRDNSDGSPAGDSLLFYDRSTNASYTNVDYQSSANIDLTLPADPSDFGAGSLPIGTRLLVKDQTNKAQNGIYVVKYGRSVSLARATDMDASGEVLKSERLQINEGVTQAGTWWADWYTGSFTLDTTGLYFIETPENLQFEDCKYATTASLTYPFTGLTAVDGVALVANDRILVKNQAGADRYQNGIWKAAAGSWTRATDMDGNTEIFPQGRVYITAGATNSGKTYEIDIVSTPASYSAPYTIGTTLFSWTEKSDLATFNGPISGWDNMPTSEPAPSATGDLGDASLESDREAYSTKFAVAVRTNASSPEGQVRNFRFLAKFETTDG